jgi:hypothetical protein
VNWKRFGKKCRDLIVDSIPDYFVGTKENHEKSQSERTMSGPIFEMEENRSQ